MTAGDLSFENGFCYYSYRGKGGKTGRREYPQPALDALRAELAAFGKDLGVIWRAFGIALALTGGRRWTGPDEWHVLRPVPALPHEGGTSAGRPSSAAPHRCQATP